MTVVRRPRPRWLAPAALASSLVLAAAACTGERPHLVGSGAGTSTTQGPDGLGPSQVEVAQARTGSIPVYASATVVAPARRITTAEATSAPGVPIVFLVKDVRGDRFEVYLPVAPAGSSGWVRRSDVTLSTVSFRIEVSLGAHRIRVYDGDTIVLDEPAGIGLVDRVTPGGIYFVKELLQAPDPSGPYGPYAYGLSGFTTLESSFDDGAGIIGIHGTNEPSSVGTDAASGCVRLDNRVITRLVDDIGLPLGTPVEILE